MKDENTHKDNKIGGESKERSKSWSFILFLKDIRLTFSLFRDYWKGNYRDVAPMTVVSVVVALLYMVSPIDLMTDMIPVIGWVDDVAIILFCMKLLQGDLEKYRKFKADQENPEQ